MSDSDLDSLVDEEDLDFTSATSYVHRNPQKFISSDLLKLYGLYKQATEGPCNIAQPTKLSLKARPKWDAWNKLGKLPQSEAQRDYVALLNTLVPTWENEENDGSIKKNITGWVVHSIESVPNEDPIPQNEKNVFDHVKDNNMKLLCEDLKPADLLTLDENGMGLIHWATDRNAVDIIEYLVLRGANINQRDSEQQTPLHYAASCGHVEAVNFFLTSNADLTLHDAENQTCVDVADNDHIRSILQAKKCSCPN